MPTLFSYRMIVDCGLAPNPFGGVCTLNLCKPKIRERAQVGDWIVGTGCSRMGLVENVIYAMEVSEILTMEDYDAFCKENLEIKIPNTTGPTYKQIVGDNNYDFSTDPAKVRGLLHDESRREGDREGKKTLLSFHFYYFGEKAINILSHLRSLVNVRGHKSGANNSLYQPFLDWILKQDYAKNKVWAEPFDRREVTTGSQKLKTCSFEKEANDKSIEVDSLHVCL